MHILAPPQCPPEAEPFHSGPVMACAALRSSRRARSPSELPRAGSSTSVIFPSPIAAKDGAALARPAPPASCPLLSAGGAFCATACESFSYLY